MRTLAVLVFIAGAAAVAGYLAQRKTIADGRVLEADLLAQLRGRGVTALACDPKIPIGIEGAVFRCVATLASGATQTVEYRMDREGDLQAEVAAGTAKPAGTQSRIPPSGDPWAN